MCTTSSSNNLRSGRMVELGDTPVLGTGCESSTGSTPVTPTKNLDTLMDTFLGTWIRYVKKGELVVLGFKTYVSLRNYHHTFFLSQVGNTIVITCLFLKNLSLHLCDSLVSNRIKTQRINHKCNKK